MDDVGLLHDYDVKDNIFTTIPFAFNSNSVAGNDDERQYVNHLDRRIKYDSDPRFGGYQYYDENGLRIFGRGRIHGGLFPSGSGYFKKSQNNIVYYGNRGLGLLDNVELDYYNGAYGRNIGRRLIWT